MERTNSKGQTKEQNSEQACTLAFYIIQWGMCCTIITFDLCMVFYYLLTNLCYSCCIYICTQDCINTYIGLYLTHADL